MIYLKTLLAESKLRLNIPSDIKKLYKLFKKNNKQLFVVGGAVRDAILGSSPKDFDLATDAKPEEVEAIAKQGGFKTVDVGKSFGVVVVNGHEIATFRKDIGKGRRPDAVDYTDIMGDVQRRDLTINALFYDIGRSEIVDLVGGIKDLKKKQIRTVGKPEQRFDEDPLRKLRAIRFAGSVGGRMSKDTWEALKKNPDLSGVSAERIRDEFVKGITKAKNVPTYLKMAHSLGMFRYIFPNLRINTKFTGSRDYIVTIANLLHMQSDSKVYQVLKQMKYTNQEVRDISHLLKMLNFNVQDIYELKVQEKNTTLNSNQIKDWHSIVGGKVKKIWNFKLSVSSKDAIAQGFKGKDIGNYIKNKEQELFNKF
tara:strand:+ start:2553 stop:3653 length:1101 start_codon:yes stop_codon:yes gene_type:complete